MGSLMKNEAILYNYVFLGATCDTLRTRVSDIIRELVQLVVLQSFRVIRRGVISAPVNKIAKINAFYATLPRKSILIIRAPTREPIR